MHSEGEEMIGANSSLRLKCTVAQVLKYFYSTRHRLVSHYSFVLLKRECLVKDSLL